MRNFVSIWKPEVAGMFAGILLLGMGRGWAQMAHSQNFPDRDLFTPYHDSLSSAADGVLAAPVQPSVGAPRSNSAAAAPSIETATTAMSAPARAINRVRQLRPIIEPILHEEQVPTELAAIVLVESGGQPTALSPKGARGLWQFMPETARRYGLTVTPEHDERLDVAKSTRAAARYLRDLHERFQDWQLAFAAYNAGGEAVERAIGSYRTNDFRELISRRSLPLETSKYVPAVMAAMGIFGNSSARVVPTRSASAAWVVYAETRRVTGGEK